MYPALGNGMVPTDAEGRYFPQAEELSKSFGMFFSITGPFYSAFLLLFQKLSGNMIVGPVITQHILGIMAALLVFFYFRKVNLSLAFIVTVFVYSSVLVLWNEHSILREALAGFFLVLWVVVLFLAVRETKYLRFVFGLLTAFIGIILVFIRIEFLVLFFLMPLVLVVGRKMQHQDFSFKDKPFLRWTGGYACLLVVFIGVYLVVPGQLQVKQNYGNLFSIAWHALQPEVFYYDNSRYPELLEAYQKVLESEEGYLQIDEAHHTVFKMQPFNDATIEYLSVHPEISLSWTQMMDRMYIDMMTHNTVAYLKSYATNVQNHLLGEGENIRFTGVFNKVLDTRTSGVPIVNSMLKGLTVGLDWLYDALQSLAFLWLFVVALLFAGFRRKKLPAEVVTALIVSVVHILVLAFLSNAAHRFRSAIDPFLYFAQIYLIYIFLRAVFTRPVARVLARLPSNRHDV
ncbi:MAG: hypothetical protein Q8O05_04580 [Chloroflexota bacterium]|nr:hypothetical protein [Chloroflexota bacterium]